MFRELLLMSNTGEYIEGTATADFKLNINGGPIEGGVQYDVTVTDGKWRWDKPRDIDVTSLRFIFCEQKNNADGELTRYANNTVTSVTDWTVNTSNVTDMSCAFQDTRALTSVDLSNFDTSAVTDMHRMFNACSALTSLDVTKFDTSKVTSLQGMFNGCSSLTSIDVTGFDTSNVTDMSSLFGGCSSLTSIDVTKFDTSKVTTMFFMFGSCESLTSLDVTKFDTSNVTVMSYMFYNCNALPSIDVSNFSVLKTWMMASMFSGCDSFKSLDLSNFIYQGETGWNTSNMFTGCGANVLDIREFYVSYDKMNNTVSEMRLGSATEVILGGADTDGEFANAVLSFCLDNKTAPDGYHWEIFTSSERGTVVGLTADLT